MASVGVELFVKRQFLATLLPGEMLKRDDKVYTQVVSNCSAKTLLPILKQFSNLENSTIFSDSLIMGWPITEQKSINGIFWGYAKHRKFKGIKRQNFILHLKECEFRYKKISIKIY